MFVGTFGGVEVLMGESFQQVLEGNRIDITLRKTTVIDEFL